MVSILNAIPGMAQIKNAICFIVLIIHGNNIPIISMIFDIIKKILIVIISVIIVINILFYFLKEYIRDLIEKLPFPLSDILEGIFDVGTGNILTGAEELSDGIVLNGWWDPGPAAFQFNKTCKEIF